MTYVKPTFKLLITTQQTGFSIRTTYSIFIYQRLKRRERERKKEKFLFPGLQSLFETTQRENNTLIFSFTLETLARCVRTVKGFSFFFFFQCFRTDITYKSIVFQFLVSGKSNGVPLSPFSRNSVFMVLKIYLFIIIFKIPPLLLFLYCKAKTQDQVQIT